jgi:hypothetical protein
MSPLSHDLALTGCFRITTWAGWGRLWLREGAAEVAPPLTPDTLAAASPPPPTARVYCHCRRRRRRWTILHSRNQWTRTRSVSIDLHSSLALKPKLVLYKNSVLTSKKTQHFSITKISWFVLLREIVILKFLCGCHTPVASAVCCLLCGELQFQPAIITYNVTW